MDCRTNGVVVSDGLQYRWPRFARKFSTLCLAAAAALVLSGCAGVGVVETNDPYRKLAQVNSLEQQGRIGVARRLNLDAIEAFEKNGDQRGLAEAYRRYGFLVRAHGEDVILRTTPVDPRASTNVDGRLDKSIVYFEKSLKVVLANPAVGTESNLHYAIGVSHHFAGRKPEACASFDKSLSAFNSAKAKDPTLKAELPEGLSSMEEFVEKLKRDAACEP